MENTKIFDSNLARFKDKTYIDIMENTELKSMLANSGLFFPVYTLENGIINIHTKQSKYIQMRAMTLRFIVINDKYEVDKDCLDPTYGKDVRLIPNGHIAAVNIEERKFLYIVPLSSKDILNYVTYLNHTTDGTPEMTLIYNFKDFNDSNYDFVRLMVETKLFVNQTFRDDYDSRERASQRKPTPFSGSHFTISDLEKINNQQMK